VSSKEEGMDQGVRGEGEELAKRKAAAANDGELA
jgi:hypothetical protein